MTFCSSSSVGFLEDSVDDTLSRLSEAFPLSFSVVVALRSFFLSYTDWLLIDAVTHVVFKAAASELVQSTG